MGEPLAWLDGLRLRMHLSMCGNCSQVADPLACVHEMAPDLFAEDSTLDDSEGQHPVSSGR